MRASKLLKKFWTEFSDKRQLLNNIFDKSRAFLISCDEWIVVEAKRGR